MNAKPKPFDTVSSATLRDSDLLESMRDVLKQYHPKKYAELIQKCDTILEKYGDFGYISYLNLSGQEQDELCWLIHEDLHNAMNDLAPAGCYYDSHPGDGALFGFWPDEDSPLWE